MRPDPPGTAGRSSAALPAIDTEESDANRTLADLEKLDVDTPEFARALAAFERAVLTHAVHEEQREFPVVREKASRDQREGMGLALLAAERIAPTHPHPTAAGSPVAQWTLGPFASLVDRARDAVHAATAGAHR